MKRPARAFSLIEMLGVLAIIAVLAALLVPVVIKRVDRAAWIREMSDLGSISNALTLQIVRNKWVPNETTWAQAAANWSMVPTAQITTTPRGYNRVYLIDPNLSLSGPNNSGSLFLQTNNTGLSSRPLNARLLLVSALARSNLPLTSGKTLTAANFADLWNTPTGVKPASLAASWPGTGDDICLQRLNLEPLFCQLILNNHDTNGTAAFTIDANVANPTAVPYGGLGWNGWYLSGSVVGLNSNYTAQTRHVLKGNISFVFENGAWGGQINNGPASTNLGVNFSATAVAFFNSMLNPNSQSSHGSQTVDQSAALGAMLNFMMDYTMWANDSPKFNKYGVTDIKKLQIWDLLDKEGIGSQPANVGNVQYYTGQVSGLLQ